MQQYNEFEKQKLPFEKILSQAEREIWRYNEMINSLQNMPLIMLDKKALMDRDVCLTLATCIRNEKIEWRESMMDSQVRYAMVSERLDSLRSYASKRYSMIRENIFVNGGENYFEVLSNLRSYLQSSKETVNNKYIDKKNSQSEWSGQMILGLFAFMLFYGILSIALNILFLRFLIPKRFRHPEFMKRRRFIIMASTMVTFAIVVGVLRYVVLSHNFFLMASELLMQYAWLVSVIDRKSGV